MWQEMGASNVLETNLKLPYYEIFYAWNHRVLNVQSKLPKRLQALVRGHLREMAEAETKAL
jgi:hypothetical protein